ncbi:PX domain containing 1a isoform X2 [Halichoeres trimaculatus]|uniref:PX domain containing 1a isoform X2 n=1 Tax=Halichoeres trimaculatus TaxID=147232 RepID=UPI003D9F0609
MMSEHVMSPGVHVVQVWAELLSAGQVEVRAGLSDGCFLLLLRTDEDLAQMMKRLVDSFLDDREMLSSNLLTGLLRVRAADQISDIQVKTVELNKLLQIIINLPTKFSQSEAVLAFFKPSADDQIVRPVQDHTWRKIEPPTISHEDQRVDQSMWNEVQKVDQPVWHEDQDKDQFMKYDDQNVDQAIMHLDQNIDQFMKHDDQKVDQAIRHEDQKKDQSLWHDDQNVDQFMKYDDQNVDQAIMHLEQKIDQATRLEDQKVDKSLWHEDQDLSDFRSPALSDIWRSNGFCLANTETILFDLTPPTNHVTKSDDSTDRRSDEQTEGAELEACSDPPVPSLVHLLHTWTHETDILE